MGNCGVYNRPQSFNTPVRRVEDKVVDQKVIDIDLMVELIQVHFALFAFKCQLFRGLFIGTAWIIKPCSTSTSFSNRFVPDKELYERDISTRNSNAATG